MANDVLVLRIPPRLPHQFPRDQFISRCVFLRPHHKCPKIGHYGRVVYPKLAEAAGNARGVPNGNRLTGTGISMCPRDPGDGSADGH